MGRWQNIAASKGEADQKRGKIYTKMAREIAVAIKIGGGPNPESNSKLREAIAKAKANNVPNDNINRIIKKAEGDTADNYEDILYEGYGPGGVAMLVETSTNNKNRTAADVRHFFDKFGGKVGAMGSVAYLFNRNGVIDIEKGADFDEDEFTMFALENGAEDVVVAEEVARVLTSVADFHTATVAFGESKYAVISAELQYIPTTEVELTSEEDIANYEKLVSALNANDDVMAVVDNKV